MAWSFRRTALGFIWLMSMAASRFSPWSNAAGSPLFTIPLPHVAVRKRESNIPAGLAVSRDGKRLYVALNLSNQLGEFDAATGKLLRSWDVGVAPYDVVVSGSKAYVSNWGGRRPDANSLTGPAGRGPWFGWIRCAILRAKVPSPSSIWPPKGGERNSDGTACFGYGPRPDGKYFVVANAAGDTLSVIDTRTDQIVETIWTRQNPGDLFGAAPNALAFDRSGKTLFVCNGSQNAVAVLLSTLASPSYWG